MSGEPVNYPSLNEDSEKALEEAGLFAEERRFVDEQWMQLVSLHKGRYIAVLGRSVVDSDRDFSALAERVYSRFGYRRIFMPFIAEPGKLHRIPSPRLVR